MSISDIVRVLSVAISLSLLWALLFYCWRYYRVDALRQRLFELRDDLFDFADSGGIAFEHPAYAGLRVATNSLIRFAHKLTYSRLLVGRIADAIAPYPEIERPFTKLWAAIEAVPDLNAREKLRSIHNGVLWAITVHLLTGSPMLMLEFLVRLPAGINAARRPASGVDRLEDQAIECEKSELSLQPA